MAVFALEHLKSESPATTLFSLQADKKKEKKRKTTTKKRIS